ncbi:hypothetical protein [Mucilaginibacter sp.]|uniref:hypothetical protein n=1 Tax=Mucilaginibacter sp. TaxID=1882438 RepID=UPI00284283E6|nr:hypothetical protein [Mucilaginibacter sp.]MDR3696492.1 hypothetical protein [Mucilaginibacter sp.]
MNIFLNLLKKGLIAGAKAGGAAAASWAADEVAKSLLKLVGYYSSEDEQKDRVKEWMASVSTQLEIINNQLTNMSNQMEAGFNAALAQQLFQAYSQQYNLTGPYRNTIDSSFNRLIKIMKQDYKNAGEIKAKIDELRSYARDKNLLDAAHIVANYWGRDPYASTRNILENYTDACIVAAENSSDSLLRYYMDVEYNFEFAMNYMYKAYAVLVTLSNYDKGKSANDPDKATSDWLEGEVKTTIKPIVDNFVSCTERLILSTYRPDISVKGDAMFGNPQDVRRIGIRSQLRAYLNVNMESKISDIGIIIKEYLRPSMTTNGKSKITINLEPGPQGYSGPPSTMNASWAVDGHRWLPASKYVTGPLMPHWYKVVDKDRSVKLVPFEDSDIVIMNYRHATTSQYYSYKSDHTSNELTTTGYIKCEFYHPDTLEIVTSTSKDKVSFGYDVIIAHLTDKLKEAYPIGYPDKMGGQYIMDTKAEVKSLEGHAKKGSIHLYGPSGSNPARLISVDCVFPEPYVWVKKHDFRFLVKYPISYAAKTLSGKIPDKLSGENSKRARLLLVNNTFASAVVGDYKNNAISMRACDIGIDIYAKENNNKAPYFKFTFKNKSNVNKKSLDYLSKDNEYVNQIPNVEKDKLGIPLNPGQKTDIIFEVDIWLQNMDPGIGQGPQEHYVKGEIYFGGRFAWPVPKPGFY